MRKAKVFVHRIQAGELEELGEHQFIFTYLPDYQGPPVSLTLPTTKRVYEFKQFPAFFEGLLPEGVMLEGMLRKCKIDRDDYFGQLLIVGADMVGAVTVEEIE